MDHDRDTGTVTAALLAVAAGVALLAYAADQFVLGAARVALLRRVSPLAVGVVIVGFGTSAPELLVSAFAAADDRLEIAVGNIVGSNLANLSLLLGVGAVIVPLAVASQTVRREAVLTVAAVAAFALAVQGGGIGAAEGAGLLLMMAGALWMVARGSADDRLGAEADALAGPSEHRMAAEALRTVLGLAGTIAGAQLLLWGAIEIADRSGLAESFVGATMVAVGTSLPELVTVVQSARRRQTDLIVGNLLGSNLFNALVVGGVVGLISDGTLHSPELTVVAAGGAVVVAALALTAMATSYTVTRREGLALMLGYCLMVPLLA